MQLESRQNIKRGVYRQGKKEILIVNWDGQHPCPSPSNWHYCAECDFTHPFGCHVYFSPECEPLFALDEIANKLVRLRLIIGG